MKPANPVLHWMPRPRGTRLFAGLSKPVGLRLVSRLEFSSEAVTIQYAYPEGIAALSPG